jgi:hypothetical protein
MVSPFTFATTSSLLEQAAVKTVTAIKTTASTALYAFAYLRRLFMLHLLLYHSFYYNALLVINQFSRTKDA